MNKKYIPGIGLLLLAFSIIAYKMLNMPYGIDFPFFCGYTFVTVMLGMIIAASIYDK